ncbi:hypothetical protein TNIN_258001 [Trichonephila inaurata madagascariensis]|uniref:Uncharacterized protein n=1 Tax=Trichonephila inaurata madagascariensis TaxID=2747483 RepID=A0A8X6XV64_9ARAC|nr:hypothetical protein TNIN_258001 [Trichonephila inaurata madagascariensis]
MFLRRSRKIGTGKGGHLTKIATKEGCRCLPRPINKLKREPGRRTMNRLWPEVPDTVEMRKGPSIQVRSSQGGPTNIIFRAEEI